MSANQPQDGDLLREVVTQMQKRVCGHACDGDGPCKCCIDRARVAIEVCTNHFAKKGEQHEHDIRRAE